MKQAKQGLDDYLSESLVNKLVESKVPTICKQTPCILGIDEAGRGPVLGPMSYAIAYYPKKDENVLSSMKFADSKTIVESTREKLFESLQTQDGGFRELGYIIKIISPNFISNSMLRRKKYNLNALSHDTAIDLIKAVQNKGIEIEHVYIDTVGPPLKYKEKLQKIFPKINLTITERADSKYAIVSAASICAKVMRDRIVNHWKYIECDSLRFDTFKLGSGYPADPETKIFLERSIDPVFGYPTLARFSWSTITKALEKGACECDWNEPKDDAQDYKSFSKMQNMMRNFTKQEKPTKGSVEPVKSKPGTLTTADTFFNDRYLSRIKSFE